MNSNPLNQKVVEVKNLKEIKLNRILLLALIYVGISGCSTLQTASEPRIDSTSDKSFQKSLSTLMDSGTQKQKQKLLIALLRINLEGVGSATEMLANKDDLSLSGSKIKEKLHGLNYTEIIELSKNMQSVQVILPGEEPGLTDEFRTPLNQSESNSQATVLSATSWLITTNTNGHIRKEYIVLNSGGDLSYKNESKKSDGSHTWELFNKKVRFTFNNNYSVYIGEMKSSATMKGKAANVNGTNWTWEAERIAN